LFPGFIARLDFGELAPYMGVLQVDCLAADALGLALALLVLGVFADYAHHTTAVNDLALVANLLN